MSSKRRVEEHRQIAPLLNERSNGKFTRSINLPQPVDADQVTANFDNGVLTLDLPKVPEVQPRQIPVKIKA